MIQTLTLKPEGDVFFSKFLFLLFYVFFFFFRVQFYKLIGVGPAATLTLLEMLIRVSEVNTCRRFSRNFSEKSKQRFKSVVIVSVQL